MFSKFNCRQCGEKLDIFEFGPKEICPHCGKETAPVNIKEVHVNFSDTTYGEPSKLSREASYRFVAGVDYIKVCFSLELSIGDISSPPRSNSFAYAHRYYSYKSMEMILENHIKKLSQAEDDAIVYLWINERDVNAYLNLLKFSALFRRFEEVYLIRCCSEEDMQNDEYEPNDSFSNRTRITRDELDAMTVKYLDVVNLGGEYRIGCYGDVRICSEEYMERFVMDQITDEYLGFNSIYIKVQELFEEATGYIIHYNMVKELVWRLMTKRRVQSKGACEWWGDPSYNNMLSTQSFCLNHPKARSYTYDDALEIVCEAFEWGYTYPLYDIIANDAVLKFEDGVDSFYGKDDIIKFIENDGSARIHVNEEKVSCDILRIAEGERYGIGDLCILLCYEQKDSKKNHYVVKVHFENNQIVKIQLFNPIGPLRLVADEE